MTCWPVPTAFTKNTNNSKKITSGGGCIHDRLITTWFIINVTQETPTPKATELLLKRRISGMPVVITVLLKSQKVQAGSFIEFSVSV
jgi:hypothetical protein